MVVTEAGKYNLRSERMKITVLRLLECVKSSAAYDVDKATLSHAQYSIVECTSVFAR